MTTDERREVGVAVAMLALVALAAGLEGGTERMYGGVALALAGVVAGGWAFVRGFDQPGRLGTVGLVAFGAVLAVQALPWPAELRSILAPGQARWLSVGAGSLPEGAIDGWLDALARYDLDAALGVAGDWTYDPLAGVSDGGWHIGGTSAWGLVWCCATIIGCALVFAVGAGLGRSRLACLVLAVGMLLLGTAEAVFGLANRTGGSTGLSTKVYYLGSATGTFINRGQFGAFLALSVGSAWGLAAALFPLLPEEVRRHASRKRRSSQPPGILDGSGDKLPRLTLLAFGTALLMVALIASQSRAALIGVLASGVGIGAWTRWRRGDAVHLGLGFGVPAVGLVLSAVAFGPRGALGRFATVFSRDISFTSRVQFWGEGVRAWMDAPVFGWGGDGWLFAQPMHEVGAHLFLIDHAHNEPLEWLVDTGVLGFGALLVIGFAYVSSVGRRLDVVEHDARSSFAVGALVAVGAVALQALGDFPTRSPGVAIPFALLAGAAWGALAEEPTVDWTRPAPSAWRTFGIAASVAGFLFAALAVAHDLRLPGERRAKLSDLAPEYYAGGAKTAAEAVVWRDGALAAVDAIPVDPSAHLAVARAEAKLALARRKAGARGLGDRSEDHAFAADVAVSRALRLRPRDPRFLVTAGGVYAHLSEVTATPDAFEERATRAFIAAIAMDPWRAEEAFKAADMLSIDALARIAAAAGPGSFAQSRTLYQYGRALERRGEKDEAVAIYSAAADAEPTFGPPSFAAGVILRGQGDGVGAERWLRRFLRATEKPGGMEGWAYHFIGNEDAADARLRRVVQGTPGNAWAWEGLAEVAHADGDARSEREAWTKVIDLQPENGVAVARLRALDGK